MIPYLSWTRRILAWLLWRFEGFTDLDEACFYTLDHPELLRTVSLLRDYYYNRRADV